MVTKSTQYFLYLQDKSNKITHIDKLAATRTHLTKEAIGKRKREARPAKPLEQEKNKKVILWSSTVI